MIFLIRWPSIVVKGTCQEIMFCWRWPIQKKKKVWTTKYLHFAAFCMSTLKNKSFYLGTFTNANSSFCQKALSCRYFKFSNITNKFALVMVSVVISGVVMTKKNRNVSTIFKYKDYRRIFEISYLKKSNKWRISYKFKYLVDENKYCSNLHT